MFVWKRLVHTVFTLNIHINNYTVVLSNWVNSIKIYYETVRQMAEEAPAEISHDENSYIEHPVYREMSTADSFWELRTVQLQVLRLNKAVSERLSKNTPATACGGGQACSVLWSKTDFTWESNTKSGRRLCLFSMMHCLLSSLGACSKGDVCLSLLFLDAENGFMSFTPTYKLLDTA